MAEYAQWEYRVATFGSCWRGVDGADLEAVLNEWGEEGWEVIGLRTVEKLEPRANLALRPLARVERRRREMPGR